MQNRAKIFMPFDALSGLKEALKRVEKMNEKKYYQDESIISKINKLHIGDRVEVTYFYNFDYISTIGQVKKIDKRNKSITVSNGIILFDEIEEIKKKL